MKRESLREAYGQALVEAGKRNKDVVVLEADLGKSTRSCLFEEIFPDRYFEMSIAEQNMASTAAGLALVGKIPFIHSFAVFATGRAYDQIRQAIAIPRLNVKICGSSCGLSDFGDGSTHQSIEDVALMSAIPNMVVLVPADAVETKKMVEAMVKYKGPVYIRINRNDLPVYTPENLEYEIGRMYTLREGKDVVVFANGVMVSRAMEAAEILQREGISIEVVNVSTVKPLDVDTLVEKVRNFKGAVIAEEHSIIGGLGSAIALALCKRKVNVPLEFVAIEDKFGTSASNYEELLVHYGLSVENICEKVKSLI
ncbi:transketolase [Caldicoprobacter guelmensis]|uniref:transketolase family protein n=1 Tax=Caldicoprobacter guelmensis TaxID=1170224 RepID=UPI00195D3823|nr:transketolase C-terminal domain-containing protein [Caldicoprobacter guelmensis]MBM7583405.1 transketolase [Caldicoprobacter guelmensis]